MKKCLCVRGLKNSPFRVVCLLAEQRQGSVSEICCKDYLVCILYQGTANRIFFLRPALAVPHLLRKDSSFLCILPLGPRSSLNPFSPTQFIFSSKPLWKHQLSLSKNCRIVVSISCTSGGPNTANLTVLCDLCCPTKLFWQGQWLLCPPLTSSLNFAPYLFFSSLFHPALSHLNTAHDSAISSLQLVAIYDTTLSFFWHRHLVYEGPSPCDRVGHSCGSMLACPPQGSLVVLHVVYSGLCVRQSNVTILSGMIVIL